MHDDQRGLVLPLGWMVRSRWRNRGLIGAELALMKTTAWLVNTSRGPIVEENALVQASRSRAIAGAALDVFDVEPLRPTIPLRTWIMAGTPHIGYVAEDLYRTFYGDAAAAISAFGFDETAEEGES